MQLGSYRLERQIGEGGIARVYLATHAVLERRYAVKVLKPDFASSATLIERLRREARTTSVLRHENIVEVVDFGMTDEGAPYLVLEWIDGRSVQEVIDASEPIHLGRAARIVTQIAAGLATAHEKGIVHRDLKPSNVMLTNEDDTAKILDFGIALSSKENAARLTRAGHVIGTPAYLAPEVLRGNDANVKSDIFSLGAIGFALLTGRVPFTATEPLPMLEERMRGVDEVPEACGLGPLVKRMLAPKPSDRPVDAHEVRAAIERLDLPAFEIPDRSTVRPRSAIPPSETEDYPVPAPDTASYPGATTAVTKIDDRLATRPLATPPLTAPPSKPRPMLAILAVLPFVLVAGTWWYLRGGSSAGRPPPPAVTAVRDAGASGAPIVVQQRSAPVDRSDPPRVPAPPPPPRVKKRTSATKTEPRRVDTARYQRALVRALRRRRVTEAEARARDTLGAKFSAYDRARRANDGPGLAHATEQLVEAIQEIGPTTAALKARLDRVNQKLSARASQLDTAKRQQLEKQYFDLATEVRGQLAPDQAVRIAADIETLSRSLSAAAGAP